MNLTENGFRCFWHFILLHALLKLLQDVLDMLGDFGTALFESLLGVGLLPPPGSRFLEVDEANAFLSIKLFRKHGELTREVYLVDAGLAIVIQVILEHLVGS